MQIPASPPKDSKSVGLDLGAGICILDPAKFPWSILCEAEESCDIKGILQPWHSRFYVVVLMEKATLLGWGKELPMVQSVRKRSFLRLTLHLHSPEGDVSLNLVPQVRLLYHLVLALPVSSPESKLTTPHHTMEEMGDL